MIKQSEWVVMHLFKCGQCDLSILDDIEYNLDGILDELVENNNLSLTSLIRAVFQKGVDDLDELIKNIKPDVIEDLQILDETLPKESDSPEVIDKKEAALDAQDVYLSHKYDIEWGDKIPEYIEELSEINPFNDIDWYINCLDTHINIVKHQDIYRRFFSDQISQIEDKIGFYFSNY
jgi:hypothetical protein